MTLVYSSSFSLQEILGCGQGSHKYMHVCKCWFICFILWTVKFKKPLFCFVLTNYFGRRFDSCVWWKNRHFRTESFLPGGSVIKFSVSAYVSPKSTGLRSLVTVLHLIPSCLWNNWADSVTAVLFQARVTQTSSEWPKHSEEKGEQPFLNINTCFLKQARLACCRSFLILATTGFSPAPFPSSRPPLALHPGGPSVWLHPGFPLTWGTGQDQSRGDHGGRWSLPVMYLSRQGFFLSPTYLVSHAPFLGARISFQHSEGWQPRVRAQGTKAGWQNRKEKGRRGSRSPPKQALSSFQLVCRDPVPCFWAFLENRFLLLFRIEERQKTKCRGMRDIAGRWLITVTALYGKGVCVPISQMSTPGLGLVGTPPRPHAGSRGAGFQTRGQLLWPRAHRAPSAWAFVLCIPPRSRSHWTPGGQGGCTRTSLSYRESCYRSRSQRAEGLQRCGFQWTYFFLTSLFNTERSTGQRVRGPAWPHQLNAFIPRWWLESAVNMSKKIIQAGGMSWIPNIKMFILLFRN